MSTETARHFRIRRGWWQSGWQGWWRGWQRQWPGRQRRQATRLCPITVACLRLRLPHPEIPHLCDACFSKSHGVRGELPSCQSTSLEGALPVYLLDRNQTFVDRDPTLPPSVPSFVDVGALRDTLTRLWQELQKQSEQREWLGGSVACCSEAQLGEYRRHIERLAELLDDGKLLSGAGSQLALTQALCNGNLTREQANAELSSRLHATSRMQQALRNQLLGPAASSSQQALEPSPPGLG